MKMQPVVIFNPTTTRPYIQQHMSLQILSKMEEKNYLTLIGFIKCFVQHSYFYHSRNFKHLYIYMERRGERKNVITARENILTARQSESNLCANLRIFPPSNHEASTAIGLTKPTSND